MKKTVLQKLSGCTAAAVMLAGVAGVNPAELLPLLTAPVSAVSIASTQITTSATHNFTTDGLSSSYFDISGNLSTAKGDVTYNGMTLTQCLKMESATTISFSTGSAMTLTLVIKDGTTLYIDSTKYDIPTSNVLTVQLAAGSHSIAKGSGSSNLYYMSVTGGDGSSTIVTTAPSGGDSSGGGTITPVSGAIYVSPSGSGSGTESSPMSLSKALTSVSAGGTIYCLAGTYKFSSPIVIDESNSGSSGKYKTLSAAPGASVTFDFSGESTSNSNYGFVVDGDYWHFYGVKIQKAGDNGMLLSGNNNIIEFCEFAENQDTGLQIARYKSSNTSLSSWPQNNIVLNCSSHDNCDDATMENADGFAAKLTCGNGNVFDGCFSYNNSDDGWDLYAKTETGAIGVVTIQNCVAFRNGFTSSGKGYGNCDGNGFKLGGGGVGTRHVVKNCLAFENLNCGFTDNNNPEFGDMSNCTSYNNGIGGNGKANYYVYRCSSSAKLSGLVTYYNTSKVSKTNASGIKVSNDKFKGSVSNSVYYNGKYYYSSGSFTADGSSPSTGTTVTLSDSDFKSLNVAAMGTNFHSTWRTASGVPSLGGFGETTGTYGSIGSHFASIKQVINPTTVSGGSTSTTPSSSSTSSTTSSSTTSSTTSSSTTSSTTAQTGSGQMTQGDFKLISSGGWNEMLYATISGVSDSQVTGVSYSGAASGKLSGDDLTYLVRDVSGGVRVDIPGLKAGTYSVTFETTKGNATVSGIQVSAQDRSGYAHFNYTSGVGAYNDDGTLKANAVVLYVTDSNKNSVTVTSKDGTTVTGIGNILNSSGKESSNGQTAKGGIPNSNKGIIEKIAKDGTPLVVRIIGDVKAPSGLTAYDSVDYGGSVGDNGYMARMQSGLNVTIEGIGNDAQINGWGIHFICESGNPTLGKSFEVRNLKFRNVPEDCIGMEGVQDGSTVTAPVERCWIHNNEFYAPSISNPAESDKAGGDGACDFKRGNYFTNSYNYYEGYHKTNLVGASDSNLQFHITFHHNYWKNCESRGPLARQANIHMYNNVFQGQTSYCQNPRADAYIFSEYNLFDSCKNPQQIKQGAIKSFNDTLTNCKGDMQATVVTSKSTKVSSNNKYGDFDTNSSLSYIPSGSYQLQTNTSNLLTYFATWGGTLDDQEISGSFSATASTTASSSSSTSSTSTTTTTTTAATTTPAAASILKGDLNGNNEVEMTDAVMLAKAAAGIDVGLTTDGRRAAELDGVDGISSGDLTKLLLHLAGLLTDL